jgi:Putative auto-transporter adhesin, head GIN domain
MRNSQLAVLGALGFVVAVMLGVAVWIRLVAEPAPELSGQRASGSYDYSGFTGVEAEGQWEVAIERGDAWRIAIEAPEELLDDIEVELEGDELSLGYEGGWCAGCFRDGNTLKATVTMPELESLDLSGATKLSFSGFDGASLSLDMSGAGELRGAASRFDSLIVDMSGAGNLDLGDVTVTNAEVDISGAGNVTLRMGGGRLSGDMSGFGNLEYYGTVSEQTVESSGFVNVRRRN